ncbi:MAG: hypothetical protein ACKOFW_21000, partial [Planctomycetaceae bacterium]
MRCRPVGRSAGLDVCGWAWGDFGMRNLNALFARYIHRLRTSRLVTRRPGSALRRASRPLRAPGGGWETLEARVLLRTITENVTTNGADYSLTDSDEIVIAAGVVIDTSSLTGRAGNISLSAPSITLDTGARLLATATGGDGTIELSARDTLKNPKISLFNQLENLALVAGQRNLQSAISLASGVEIAGGDVTLATESGNPSENKVYNQVVSLVVQPLGPFLMEALEKPDLFAGPLAFQLWKPSATISIDSATLTSSHSLSITSTADANASGKAVYNRVVGVEHAKSSGRFGGAAGYFETDAVATISVTGASVIHAEEELTVSTTVDNAIALEVLAIKNNGISPTNPQAIDLAGGYTLLHTTSTVQIGEGSQLVAGGTVEIAAEATDENEVGVTANAYRDGTLGASYAMMKSGATVQVLVAGQVSSGVVAGTVDDLPELEFNPALAVDFATDSLLFPTPVPFATGAPLYFTSASGATVPGLVPGSVYFAIASGSNTNQLQLATTREQALAGEAISFGTPFPTLTVAGVTLPISVLDSAVSNSVLFGFANGTGGVPTLQSGQVVTYTPAPGRLIGYNDAQGNLLGLLPAGQYTLELVDSINPELFPLACQLQTTSATQLPGFAAGAVVLLNDASVLTSADGTWLPIYGFDLDASQLDLNPPAVDPTTGEPVTTPPATIPLQNGAAVVFHSGLNNPAGNLVDGTTYYALVDASNPGVIR